MVLLWFSFKDFSPRMASSITLGLIGARVMEVGVYGRGDTYLHGSQEASSQRRDWRKHFLEWHTDSNLSPPTRPHLLIAHVVMTSSIDKVAYS